jgi:hypothetical protein
MTWCKLWLDWLSDPKVQLMSEQNQRRLVCLFCLQGAGHLPCKDENIAHALRITMTETIATKKEFIVNGFINKDWTLVNWNKRQNASSDSLSRVRKHRYMKRYGNVTVTLPETLPSVTCNVTCNDQNRTEQREENTIQDKATPSLSPAAFPRGRARTPARSREPAREPAREANDADLSAFVHERSELNGEPPAPPDDRTEDLKREAIQKLKDHADRKRDSEVQPG